MKRQTIRDLATEAGVSVSTVNRVLAGDSNVRASTKQRVETAARSINFYGLGTIESSVAASRPKHKFGFVLHQSSRMFYRNLATALHQAAERVTDRDIEAIVEFADDLAPQAIASRMLMLADRCDAVGVVAAVHPLISETVKTIHARGIPVFALISNLSATGSIPYVGLDNWKAGRTFGWAFANILKQPGKIATLVGNHRYRCQEMNESGFRSYFREHAPEFVLLDPLSTFETSAIAQEMTEKLLREHPDLAGLLIAGGGISGVITALRDTGMSGKIMTAGFELMDTTKSALLDGTLKLVLSHPLERLADTTIREMIRASAAKSDFGQFTSILPFDIYTRENI